MDETRGRISKGLSDLGSGICDQEGLKWLRMFRRFSKTRGRAARKGSELRIEN